MRLVGLPAVAAGAALKQLHEPSLRPVLHVIYICCSSTQYMHAVCHWRSLACTACTTLACTRPSTVNSTLQTSSCVRHNLDCVDDVLHRCGHLHVICLSQTYVTNARGAGVL